jgi:glycine betaine catabolism A
VSSTASRVPFYDRRVSSYPRPPLPEGALSLPARYYTDPAQFGREMEAIHCRMWLCAGRAAALPAPGAYFVRQIGNADVIVLRDEEGNLSAFHNVCRHRGTRLCHEPEGRFAARIQCSYHGWTYRLDGTVAAAPHMEHVAGFRESDYPLRRVAVGEWEGHVFINLSEHPPPLASQLAELPEKFRPWRMAQLRMVERRTYSLRANWKLVVQNYSECLHCPIAHPLLQQQSHYMSGDNEPPRPTYLGGRMDLREGVATLSMDGTTSRSCLAGLSPEDRRRVYYYAILPNLLLNLHPDYMLTFTLWPRAADRTEIECEWHFHPDEIGKPGFDPRGAVEFWEITNRQDWQLSELAQQGIASRGYVPGPYSNREELLYALDAFVVERTREA